MILLLIGNINKMFKRLLIIILSIIIAIPVFASDKLVVSLSYFDRDDKHFLEFFRNIVKDFEKQHSIKVDIVTLTPQSTDEKHDIYYNLLSNKSSTPDIMQLDAIHIPEFASLNFILDMSPHMFAADIQPFLKNSLEEVEWNTKMWGVPFYSAVGLIAYRKDILKQNGITAQPETWYDLINIAKELQKNDLYGYVGQAALYEGLTCNVLEYLWSNGARLHFKKPVKLNSKEAQEGLEIYSNMIQIDKITPFKQMSFKEYEGFQLFKSGRALFIRNWPSVFMKFDTDADSAVAGKYAIMPIPKGPSGQSGFSTLGGWALVINKNSNNVDKAVKLVKYLTSQKVQYESMMCFGQLPSRESLYKCFQINKRYPWLKEVYQLIRNAKVRPRTPYYPEISKLMQENFHLALKGKITSTAALIRAEKRINAFLETVNTRGINK